MVFFLIGRRRGWGVVLNTFIDAKHKCLITFKNGREHAEVEII